MDGKEVCRNANLIFLSYIYTNTNVKTMTKKATPRKKPAPKKEAVKLDPLKQYEFIVTKESKHLQKGSYFIDGIMAEVLTKKGLGNVKL